VHSALFSLSIAPSWSIQNVLPAAYIIAPLWYHSTIMDHGSYRTYYHQHVSLRRRLVVHLQDEDLGYDDYGDKWDRCVCVCVCVCGTYNIKVLCACIKQGTRKVPAPCCASQFFAHSVGLHVFYVQLQECLNV